MQKSTKGMAKSAQMSAIITRKDGTVENLGTIAYWHRNPLKRWAWSLKKSLSTLIRRFK